MKEKAGGEWEEIGAVIWDGHLRECGKSVRSGLPACHGPRAGRNVCMSGMGMVWGCHAPPMSVEGWQVATLRLYYPPAPTHHAPLCLNTLLASASGIAHDGDITCAGCHTHRVPLIPGVTHAGYHAEHTYARTHAPQVGSHRWWPARIVPEDTVPPSMLGLPRAAGEFPVRFFGSHDYYWLCHGSVSACVQPLAADCWMPACSCCVCCIRWLLIWPARMYWPEG